MSCIGHNHHRRPQEAATSVPNSYSKTSKTMFWSRHCIWHTGSLRGDEAKVGAGGGGGGGGGGDWVRPWILRRREFGIYDQLMVKLRNEDRASFTNFLRMPPGMNDELRRREGPRITKTFTRYREPLEPAGLKLALTLHHLAHGNKYASMNVCLESIPQHHFSSLFFYPSS